MHKTFLKEITRKTGKYKIRLYFLESILLAGSLILFYAAGLTLNALYAQIGSTYVSLLALLVGSGVCAARWLFAIIRDHVKAEYEECLQEEMDSLLENNEEFPEGTEVYADDTVRLVTGGVHDTDMLVISSVIVCIVLLFYSMKCGMIFLAGSLIGMYGMYRLAQRNVVSEERFAGQLCGLTELAVFLNAAGVLCMAVFEMKKGSLGLYGLLAMIFILMEYSQFPLRVAGNMLKTRRQLFSLAQMEKIRDGEMAAVPAQKKEKEESGSHIYTEIIRILRLLAEMMLFYTAVQAALNILSLKADYSLKTCMFLMFVCPLISGYLRVLQTKLVNRYTDSKETAGILSLAHSLFAAVVILKRSSVLSALVFFCLMAMNAAVPFLMREKDSDTEKNTVSVLQAVLLIAVIGGGILLYWQGKADSAAVISAAVMFMSSSLLVNDKEEGMADEGNDE